MISLLLLHDQYCDVLLNQTGIIEVLAETTKEYDRGEKFLRYQHWNPTLTDYLPVSQTQPVVEHFVRQANGGWSYRVYRELTEHLTIQSIACTLHLAEVYDRIEFPMESTESVIAPRAA